MAYERLPLLVEIEAAGILHDATFRTPLYYWLFITVFVDSLRLCSSLTPSLPVLPHSGVIAGLTIRRGEATVLLENRQFGGELCVTGSASFHLSFKLYSFKPGEGVPAIGPSRRSVLAATRWLYHGVSSTVYPP